MGALPLLAMTPANPDPKGPPTANAATASAHYTKLLKPKLEYNKKQKG